MGCQTICRFCEHVDMTREKSGMVRCLKKHVFVKPDSTCQFHSFHFTMDDAVMKELMAFIYRKT